MKNKLSLFFVLLTLTLCANAKINSKDAHTLMNALRDKVDTKHLVSFDFESIFTDKTDNTSSVSNGSLQVQNSMYIMNLEGVSVYFDGMSKWTVNHKAKEVIIESAISAFRDILTNPYTIIKNHEENFKSAIKNEALTRQELSNNITMVMLYPKDLEMPFTMIKIKLNNKTIEPRQITYLSKDGTEVTVNIKNFKEARSVDRHRFIFKMPKDYTEIDLR